jgi:hypothetical protein
MAKEVTFTPAALKAVIAEAVALAMAGKKADGKAAAQAGKSERSLKNEIAVVKAFKKAGFGDVRPHIDVKTFNRWVAEGLRPIEGSKSLKIKNLRLFHRTQCRAITLEEKAALQAQSDAAVARHDADAKAAMKAMNDADGEIDDTGNIVQ